MRSVHEEAPVAPSGDAMQSNQSHVEEDDSYGDKTVKIDIENGTPGEDR